MLRFLDVYTETCNIAERFLHFTQSSVSLATVGSERCRELQNYCADMVRIAWIYLICSAQVSSISNTKKDFGSSLKVIHFSMNFLIKKHGQQNFNIFIFIVKLHLRKYVGANKILVTRCSG